MTFHIPTGGEGGASHVPGEPGSSHHVFHDVPEAPGEGVVEADFELHEAEHRRALIAATEPKAGDLSKIWRRFGFVAGDEFYYRGPRTTSKFSPMFSLAIMDGKYVQALVGNLSFVLPILGVVFGVLASLQVHGNAIPPLFPLMAALSVLGILSGFAGLMGFLVFLMGCIATGHFTNEHQLITLFMLGCSWFAGPQIGARLRPMKSHHDKLGFDRRWHQVGDFLFQYVLTAFILGKFFLIYPLVSGYDVPIKNYEHEFWVVVAVAILVRLSFETVVREWFPRRSLEVSAMRLAVRNRWLNLFFIVVVQMAIVVMAIHIAVGNIWQLWAISIIYGLMLVVERITTDFPKVTWLRRLVPSGVARILLVVVLAQLSAKYFIEHGYTTANVLTAMIFLLVAAVLFMLAVIEKFDGDPWGRHPIWKVFGFSVVLGLVLFGSEVVSLV
ncbi:MAG: hypothetical protein WCL38_01230 [Actinomycetota bacterium]